MTRVCCPLEDCGYRHKNGTCKRPIISLSQTETRTNEMYCLGWMTPETKLFVEIAQYPQVMPEALPHD